MKRLIIILFSFISIIVSAQQRTLVISTRHDTINVDANHPANRTLVISDRINYNACPTIAIDSITGSYNVDSTLIVHYTYNDANGDSEGATLFDWYYADDSIGTNKNYWTTNDTITIPDSLNGKRNYLKVTPKSLTGCKTGLVVESEWSEQIFNYYAKLLFARMTTQPSEIEKMIYSNTFDTLGGMIDTLDGIHGISTFSEEAAKLNWISDTFNLTESATNPTFTEYFGYTGNGTSAYLNTNFIPSGGTKFQQNSACFGFGLDSIANYTGDYWGSTGSVGHTSTFIIPVLDGNTYGRVNTTGNNIHANTAINKSFAVNRVIESQQQLWINEDRSNIDHASNVVTDRQLCLLARNNNGVIGTFSRQNVKYDFFGGGLTDSQMIRVKRAMNYFVTAMRSAGIQASNSASENRLLMQKVLDVGDLVITVPGIYKVDLTLFIPSNRNLLFSEGVYIKSEGNYSNKFINKGALTKTMDSSITITGLKLISNGSYLPPDYVYGLRGMLGFFYIKDLAIRDFEMLDGGSSQYCIQLGKWENVLIDGARVHSLKDFIVIETGHDAVIRDVIANTYDDFVYLGGVAYPQSQTEAMGDVHDIEFINVRYDDSLKIYPARAFLCALGSWADWAVDSTYKTGDYCINSGNIYQSNNNNGFSAVAANAPVHATGIVVGADGISWHQVDTGNYYHSDIYNISVDSSYFYNPICLFAFIDEDNEYTRHIYPGPESLTNATNISVTNSTISNVYYVNSIQTGVEDITFENCLFDSTLNYFSYNYGLPIDSLTLTLTDNTFTNSSVNFIYNNKNKVFLNATDNLNTNIYFQNTIAETGTIRAINNTLPFLTLNNITPLVGDRCMNTVGYYEWDGDSWNLIE